MNIKDIIILGAGASKADKAPLQKELFMEFFERQTSKEKAETSSKEKTQEKKEQERKIINFFKDFWGINRNNYQKVEFPTFEECLGVLDLAYLRRESFKGYTEEDIEEVRNALKFLVGKILNEKLREKRTHHEKLVKRLEKEGKLEQTAFISLNYDILIDNCLMRLGFHPDYGIAFANSKRPNKNKSVLLLKIHGSLNWLYCPTCNQMKLTLKKEKKGAVVTNKGAVEAFYESKKCQVCNTPMKPVIVPPTFYKEMSNPFIQEIFLKADKVLREAERIYICGYSFPDADMHIKYLFKRAEIFRGETPEIFVINKPKDDSPEKKQFMRFFKDKKKVHYTDLAFEEFSERGF